MRIAIVGLIGIALSAHSVGAEPHWIRIQSPNFEIYSTASEGATRDTLRQFEQARAFFFSALPLKDAKPLPVRIVQFSSDKEYLPYRINEVATAYYKPGAERDMIVMSHGGVEHLPTSIHEYTHLVMRHAGFDLPPWLNEGMAEVYSTLKEFGGQISVGAPINGRLAEIQRSKWVPLSVILTADHNSPYYNEKSKAGNFYDEAWALTHMLSLGDNYRPKWGAFLTAILTGKESVDALTSTYGKPLAVIEKDLQLYVSGTSFAAGLFDAKLTKSEEKSPAEPAPAFDLKLMLLDIAVGKTKEQTQLELEKLSEQAPSRPEPYVQMGYLAWGAGKPAGAEVRERFEKAYALGSRSPRMLWDYGRIIAASNPAASVGVLTELWTLEPERRDIRIELARAQLNAHRPDDSIRTLLTLNGCRPDEAVECMSVASNAYFSLNQRDKAESAAEQYLKYAKTPQDRQRAQQLLDSIKRAP